MIDRPVADAPETAIHRIERRIIPMEGALRRWVRPWYVAYAILGVLASGLAAILIPLVIDAAHGSAGQIGLVVATLNVGVLFSPFWGMIADRTKAYRLVFLAGFLLLAAGFSVFGVLSGSAAWFVGAFVIGLGVGAANTVAGLFIVEFTPKAEWNQRISWLQTFSALGQISGLLLAGLLMPRPGMLLGAALVLPAMLFAGRGLPVPGGRFHLPQVRLHRSDIGNVVRLGEPLASSLFHHLYLPRSVHLASLRPAFSSPFGAFLVGWFMLSIASSAFFSLYPLLMAKGFGISPASCSTLYAASAALSIPLYNFAGRWAVRFGPARVLLAGLGARLIAFSGLAAVAFLHPPFVALCVVVLFALMQGVWPLLAVASTDMAAALATFGQGAAMGLFNATAAIASALGAVVGGVIAGRFGYPSICLFAAAAVLVALFFLVGLARTEPA
jgi:MFS family permease